MARVRFAVAARKARKKLLKMSKGYWGKRKNLYRIAKTQMLKSLYYSYRDRKKKKSDFRSLCWSFKKLSSLCIFASIPLTARFILHNLQVVGLDS